LKIPELRRIPSILDAFGSLGVLESADVVPFQIERVYFITQVPRNAERGSHAHKKLEQLIVALSGEFTVKLDSGSTTENFHLSSSEFGLYVPPGFWRDLINFSDDAVCLVLASTKYDESDYIREYDEFLTWSSGT
jgi:uncharacterized RmlC-like cupin family protein